LAAKPGRAIVTPLKLLGELGMTAMNLKNKCFGVLPLLLSVAACSDMSPDSDT
jgi:hypothetical protein